MCHSKKAPRGGGTSNTRNSGQQPTQATQSSNPRPVKAVQDDTSEQTEEYSLHNVNSSAPNKPIMLEMVIGASLSEPHTSEKRDVIVYAQKNMTKIGKLTCAARIQRRRLQCILIWLVLSSMPQ